MSTGSSKYRRAIYGHDRRSWVVWCPACDTTHMVTDTWTVTEHDDGTLTVDPSILLTQPPTTYRCHSYLRDGVWQYLDDCSHQHAGQSLPMVDLPAWLQPEEPTA